MDVTILGTDRLFQAGNRVPVVLYFEMSPPIAYLMIFTALRFRPVLLASWNQMWKIILRRPGAKPGAV